ncbi:MAG: hypothetical protein JWP26_2560 [Devosia sp.]|uniref:hypothetical protein n=1 Tax=Devosia sp. TaxID=1871048 RepID=UPI002616DA4A|nr:hypothetical protein [Devosia sp.]MDB5587590.1 hypothetical protein [Devosia sp.]
MNNRWALAPCLLAAAALLPVGAYAQSDVTVTRSILPDQPYTLIYPAVMTATGGAADPLTINHPDAPLQCSVTIVPAVADTNWTPDSALADFDDAKVAATWTESFPGFTVASKGTTAYQSGPALIYEGQSTNSPMGVPLTIMHTETVDGGRGYVLDCLFATEVAEKARPIASFIIANFSTKADAECCVGAEVAPEPTAPAAPAP